MTTEPSRGEPTTPTGEPSRMGGGFDETSGDVTVYSTPTPKERRTCNRHVDCEAADRRVQERTGNRWRLADHCHDDCCEDCFGS